VRHYDSFIKFAADVITGSEEAVEPPSRLSNALSGATQGVAGATIGRLARGAVDHYSMRKTLANMRNPPEKLDLMTGVGKKLWSGVRNPRQQKLIGAFGALGGLVGAAAPRSWFAAPKREEQAGPLDFEMLQFEIPSPDGGESMFVNLPRDGAGFSELPSSIYYGPATGE